MRNTRWNPAPTRCHLLEEATDRVEQLPAETNLGERPVEAENATTARGARNG